MEDGFLKASAVCKMFGISRNTLRRWELVGKIPKPFRKDANNYRYYSQDIIEKIKQLTLLKRMEETNA